ncbi:hypothetical protein ZIOFF_044172 [Zingiber officinale]|uniref:Uncharacterized protein n=1 Tax=Zingiber officinale TaxID=94328 RepID=A0A8J5FY10_ZINOF|nr:hypothetical protein ZIOFF_044172 [Zingiber officinale]
MRVLKKLPVKSILEHVYPMKGTQSNGFSEVALFFWTVKIATLDKHGEEHLVPIVAVDKPRLPPELGPLIVLSFLEMSSSNDKDD